MKRAFTLIELLIVVAIIAILAAIAVPNFLEAQTRAKVSRSKADMRTLATAVESYAVDNTKIPREMNFTMYGDIVYNPAKAATEQVYGIFWWGLSTPISYISEPWLRDPFRPQDLSTARFDEVVYTYHDLLTRQVHPATSGSPFWNGAAPAFYGAYRIFSYGPDRSFGHPGITNSAQLVYDPTNGTVSYGNIFRSQRHSTDIQPPTGTLLGAH